MQSHSATAGVPRRLLSWRRLRRRSEGPASLSNDAAATLSLTLLLGQQPAAWYRCSSARRGAASQRPTDEPPSPAGFLASQPYAWQSQYALKRTTAGCECVLRLLFSTALLAMCCAALRCTAQRGKPTGDHTFVFPIAALCLLSPLRSPPPFTTAHCPSVRLSLLCDRRYGTVGRGGRTRNARR